MARNFSVQAEARIWAGAAGSTTRTSCDMGMVERTWRVSRRSIPVQPDTRTASTRAAEVSTAATLVRSLSRAPAPAAAAA